MLTFLNLSDIAKAYIIVLCILSFILLLITLIVHMVQKAKQSSIIILSFLLIVSILDFAMLAQLNKVGRTKYDIIVTQTLALCNRIPYFVHIALNIIFVIFALFAIYNLYKNSINKINTFSVKNALENLPTGIAFMTQDTDLLLSNHIMHNLCKELTDKALQSADVFWQDLTALQDENNCVIKGKEPAFILKNGNVRQFSKTLCMYNGDEYYEFKATDITELYNLSENTRRINEKLKQQQQRLEKLTDIIEENAERGVALNMKINFHDNFGNLLTLTKKALRENENIDETRTLVDYWKNLNNVITELSSDDKQKLSLEQVLLFAENLGCKIILSGELPKGEHNNITALLCINEMLKNAYRHADAKKLTVKISHTHSEINLIIHNETKSKLPEIKEGGGLSSLRERIEQAGGTMCMTCDDGVSMSVKLLKGGEQNV